MVLGSGALFGVRCGPIVLYIGGLIQAVDLRWRA